MRYVSLFLLVVLFSSCSKKKAEVKERVPNVETAEVMTHRLPVRIDAVGNVRAFNSAELRAQVEGVLLDYHFEEGQMVKEGELLYTIDPRPYEAKLKEAQAKLLRDEALMAYNKERVERYRPLLKDDYVSKLDFDNYVTQLKEAEATVLQDVAAIEKAEIDLGYCYVKAPFVATASKRLIDKGNLITNAGQNLLLVNQVQPIFVDFSIPEKRVIPVLERQYEVGMLNVHVQPQGTKKIFKGKVQVVGNQINKKTGMVPIRAVFENGELLLWPGQFSKVHLILDHIDNAVVVPESAVNVGQQGMYSLVVTDGNVAEYKKVEVGLHLDGVYQIISGLSVGDTVITNGQLNVALKKPVNITKHDKKWVEKLDHESF